MSLNEFKMSSLADKQAKQKAEEKPAKLHKGRKEIVKVKGKTKIKK